MLVVLCCVGCAMRKATLRLVPLSKNTGLSGMYSLIYLPKIEVWKSNRIALNVTFSPAPSHAIQPVHVDAITTPEWSAENHTTVRLSHITHVASIIADIKVSSATFLGEPDIDLTCSLVMRDSERLIGVNGASIFRAHQVWIDIKGIGLATTTVTIIPVAIATIASMQGDSHGMLVTFPSIVFRAPDVVSQVCIAVVITSITRVVTRHFNEIACRVTMAFNAADINSVAEMLVIQWSLETIPMSLKWCFGNGFIKLPSKTYFDWNHH